MSQTPEVGYPVSCDTWMLVIFAGLLHAAACAISLARSARQLIPSIETNFAVAVVWKIAAYAESEDRGGHS